MPLKEILSRLQEQEREKNQWEADKPKHIKEWQDSVVGLFSDIRGYLAEYEAVGSMKFSENEFELSEESLGRYPIKSMSIIAGPATIMLVPVGTMLVGAWGRVDMYRQGRSGEQDRVVFLRLPTSRGDASLQWKVRLQATVASPPLVGRGRVMVQPQSTNFVPLDKAVIEQQLEHLLSS